MSIHEFITAIYLMIHKKQTQEEHASFDKAIPYILKNEGGLVNDKSDSGGLTNYGISYRYLTSAIKKDPSLINEIDLNNNLKLDPYDVTNMTQIEAKDIYLREWWLKYGYGRLNHQGLATKLFDLAVNMGPLRPLSFLRKASNHMVSSRLLYISEEEAKHINSLSFEEKEKLMDKIISYATEFYKSLAFNDPSKRKFLKGWLKRVSEKF